MRLVSYLPSRVLTFPASYGVEGAGGIRDMEYIIIWVVCGIGAAVIASSKGRNAFGWFIGGLLLGPIGLLIVGFMGQPAPNECTLRKCPYCAEQILKEAKVCKHCGRDVEPVDTPVSAVTCPGTVVCPDCGTELTSGATWCPKCKQAMPKNAAGLQK